MTEPVLDQRTIRNCLGIIEVSTREKDTEQIRKEVAIILKLVEEYERAKNIESR